LGSAVERPQAGQALVAFSLAFVAIVAMGGLLIDSGRAWGERREAQTAADTAALAAVKAYSALPAGTGTSTRKAAAITAGQSMSGKNGFHTGSVSCPGGALEQAVVVNNPPSTGNHAGDPLYVEVVSTRAMSTTLSAIMGQTCWLVSARAVAGIVQEVQQAPGQPFPAILATYGPYPCSKGAYMNSGSAFEVIGNVVSDSGVTDTGGGGGMTVTGTVSYVANGPNTCGSQTSSPGPASCHSTPPCGWTGTATTTTTPYPVTYTVNTSASPWTITNVTTGASSHCTYQFSGGTNFPTGPWWQDATTLKDGIYCGTGPMGLSKNGATGNVTIVATTGKVSGPGNANLHAYWDHLFVWAGWNKSPSTLTVDYSGGGSKFTGIIYAPFGLVQISGGSNAQNAGTLWGAEVATSGSNWALDATGIGSTGAPSVTTYRPGSLVE
jgi:Flp pilus assembly protein TadG